jgi:hypothetical protein
VQVKPALNCKVQLPFRHVWVHESAGSLLHVVIFSTNDNLSDPCAVSKQCKVQLQHIMSFSWNQFQDSSAACAVWRSI